MKPGAALLLAASLAGAAPILVSDPEHAALVTPHRIETVATGLRVPNSGAQDRRLENRVVGVDANPYLAIAASLVCGYLGMVNGIEPSAPATSELDAGQEESFYIPLTFDEALRIFDDADDVRQALGEDFCQLYAAVKYEEMRLFHREISPWERQHLLLNV